MANYQLLALLKKDIVRWNQWRQENLKIEVDLIGADLSGLDLQWADLRNTNLLGADLKQTTLRGADLRWSNLAKAKLTGANLQGANLCFTQLQQADLTAADLRGADLREANLHNTHFEQTNLSGALLPDHLKHPSPSSVPKTTATVTPIEQAPPAHHNGFSAPEQAEDTQAAPGPVSPYIPDNSAQDEETLELPADVLQKLIASAQAEAKASSLSPVPEIPDTPSSESPRLEEDTLADWMQE